MDEYTEGISFNDMEMSHIKNDGPRAQGTDYAKTGIRNYDEIYMEKCQAEHERAREQGSKG